MDNDQSSPAEPAGGEPIIPLRVSRKRRVMHFVIMLLLAWFLLAYFLVPSLWKGYVHIRPSYRDVPNITTTSDGHHGDPLNVSLIGTEDQVKAIFAKAGWFPADRLGLRSDLRIAADTVLRRPYDAAPVSRAFLFGRKEDLAFEKPVGNDPKKRNHVRFWKSPDANPDDDRPIWIGAGSYDERVGLSHTTGQITHHISPDVDAERELIMSDLDKTGDLQETYFVDGFHTILSGKNGGGDPWHTDGRLAVGVIKSDFKSE